LLRFEIHSFVQLPRSHIIMSEGQMVGDSISNDGGSNMQKPQQDYEVI